MTAQPQEMLLLDLIETYPPMYPTGATWEEAARYLYENEPHRMAELAASLERSGWRRPVLLPNLDDLEAGELPHLLNGTHRVAIALHTGVVSLPAIAKSDLPQESERSAACLRVRSADGELSEDEEELLMDALRSFELDAATWLDTDCVFGYALGWEFVYDDITTPARLHLLKLRALAVL